MGRPRFLQRKYFIKKRFQLQFILLYLLSLLLIVGVSSWYLFLKVQDAVTTHLYSTHMKVERVGDFLFDLLFKANLSLALVIVAVVIILSLVVFNRINRKFSHFDTAIMTMANGDFTSTGLTPSCFFEVGDLTNVVNGTRQDSQKRLATLVEVLAELENGVEKDDPDRLHSGKKRLDALFVDLDLK